MRDLERHMFNHLTTMHPLVPCRITLNERLIAYDDSSTRVNKGLV